MNKPKRVAVASRSFSRNLTLRTELLAQYPEVTFNDSGLSLSGSDLVQFLSGCDGAITALETVNDAILAQLPELRVLSKYGVGYDMIDIGALKRRGIRLGWTGGVNRRSVSELVVAAVIILLRHVMIARDQVRAGGWTQLQGRQLSGRTVGIIGCGHVGQDLVYLLRGFGCRVLAHDIRDLNEFYLKNSVTAVDVEALLRSSDIVTLHLPLDDSTRGYLSRDRLQMMRRDAILINAARGGLVDETCLKQMLSTGHLAGAALDVLGEEPPTDQELLQLPNALVTPHIGGSSQEAVLAMGRAAIDGLANARFVNELWP